MTAAVDTMKYDKANGTFAPLQTTSALPAEFTGARSAAEIAVHPNGRFLYTSNRGHDSIAIFDIDPRTGWIRSGRWVSTRGKTPRHFAIDPSAAFLFAVNQESNNLSIYRMDPKTGNLIPFGDAVETPVPVHRHVDDAVVHTFERIPSQRKPFIPRNIPGGLCVIGLNSCFL